MKKLLIPFVAAFGLSLGGSTGLVMVRAPKAVAHADAAKGGGKAKPDSAKVDSAKTVAPVDSAHPAVTDTAKPATPAGKAGITTAATTSAAPGTLPLATPAPTAQATSATTPARTDKPAAASTDVRGDAAKLSKIAAATQQLQPTDTMVGRKLAQIFSAMQAKDAARVLEQMDDSDVRTIIASLNNKQQAAILGNFPTQRAAGIVRATLRAPGGNK